MNDRPTFEETILVEALALPAGARRAFIDRSCGADGAAAKRLGMLLEGYEANSEFLETSAPVAALQGAGRTFAALPPEPEPGDRIARYHLLKRIGEGGFGVVYLAEQEAPVRRLVALKVIRLGLDTREFIARFEAERQALAVMDHPNIARVFDAGATDSGRPYLVMELIRGIPITAYCDEHQLSVSARLGLFLQVCQAIQHAHQKGIIHCDLKPSNILLELHDPPGEGCPKVIDFGIAKATPDRRTAKTLFTRFHALIGTPAYTSPEQMELSGLDVDTRSDIYSLGVLLYELLTGHQPFDPDVLDNTSLEEMRRLIRDVDPPRPSARVGALEPGERARVAQRRGLDPEKLPVLLRSDLDWIVMRCLEKDRTRRYETANALATDLRRHLACEPVVARPPSRSYQIEKFARRNRTAVIAGVTVVFALVAGLILAAAGFARAREQQRSAETARLAAVAARREAEDLVSFMVRDLRPELQRVGRLPLSTQVAERAVLYFAKLPPDPNDASTERNRAIALEALATFRSAAGNPALAATLWSEALAARRRAAAVVPDDPLLIAELALTEFVDVSQSHPLVSNRALGLPETDARLAAIVDRARQACRHHLDSREIAPVYAQLLAYWSYYLSASSFRPEEGLANAREAEAIYRSLIAANPKDTGVYPSFTWLLTTIAGAVEKTGDRAGAVRVAEEALAFADRALAGNPGDTGLRENAASMAMQLSYRQGDETMEKSRAAEALARERWQALVQMDPENFTYRRKFAEAHSQEAEFLYTAGRKVEAGPVMEKYVSLLSPLAQTPDDFQTLQIAEAKLGALAAQFGHHDAARGHLARLHEWHRRFVAALTPEAAADPSVVFGHLDNQGMVLDMLADWPALEPLSREMLELATDFRRSNPQVPGVSAARSLAGYYLGRALLGQGRAAEAVLVLQEAVRDLAVTDAVMSGGRREGIILLTKVPLAVALIGVGDMQPARVVLEESIAAGEALVAAQPSVWWDWRAALAETGFLLATVLDPSRPAEAVRRQQLLGRAEALLEGHGTGNPLSVHDTELLAKIKALRTAER